MRRVIRCIAIMSRRSFACATLKEARACLAPALLRTCIFRRDRTEQRAAQKFSIERIGARGNDEFAELANAAFLEGLRFGFERLQFRIDIAWFAHVASSLWGDAPIIEMRFPMRSKVVGTVWHSLVPPRIFPCEGALIRRADVAFEV